MHFPTPAMPLLTAPLANSVPRYSIGTKRPPLEGTLVPKEYGVDSYWVTKICQARSGFADDWTHDRVLERDGVVSGDATSTDNDREGCHLALEERGVLDGGPEGRSTATAGDSAGLNRTRVVDQVVCENASV